MTRRRILPSVFLSPLGFCFAGLAACSGTSSEQGPVAVIERTNETVSGLVTRLVEDDWSLFSGGAAAEGRGIGFAFDGTLSHDERHLGDLWSIEGTSVDDCSLRVSSSSAARSQMTVELTYDRELDAFVFNGGLARMVLAPRGFELADYLDRK